MSITPRHVHISAVCASIAAFAAYLLTSAPSVSFIDAGELAAVAHTFGIAHPTGYPLFTMLTGLWAELPLGDGIVRLNIFAAVMVSVSVAILVHALWFMLGLLSEKPARRATGKGKGGSQPRKRPAAVTAPAVRLVLAVFGAMFIAFSETFWRTALSIEVYALHLPLLILLLWLSSTALYDPALDESSRARRRLLTALALGLSFTNHMTTLLVLPAFLVMFFVQYGMNIGSLRMLGRTVPAFVAGLLPYIYLPLRASAAPLLNWGNPASFERFIWHVSGKQYRVWMFQDVSAAGKQLWLFISTLPAELAFIGLLLAIVGAAHVFSAHRRLGYYLLLLFAGCIAYSINYSIHDIESYFLLAYIVCGVWAAFGLKALLSIFKALKFKPAIGAAAVMVGILIGMNGPSVSQRGNYLVEDYTHNMFASFEPGALVLSFQWDYWVSASYYYQLVEGLRKDVVVIDKELLRRSWYFSQIQRMYPEIYRRSESDIELFLMELDKFERGQPYDPVMIEERFNNMINSIIDRNIDGRPVYATLEVEEHLGANYERIPEGLAMRLYRPGEAPSVDAPVPDNFRFRLFESDDRLVKGIITMYATMLTNRGIHLYKNAAYDKAEKYFRRALEYDPRAEKAREWLVYNEAARRRG